MPDREKVMKGLETCLRCGAPGDCTGCPYIGKGNIKEPCLNPLLADALALLKEQEARVMTWDELMRCANGDPAFVEARDRSGCWVLIYPTYMGLQDKNGYGVRWRYWTSRPSPEQMRDTKWEDN